MKLRKIDLIGWMPLSLFIIGFSAAFLPPFSAACFASLQLFIWIQHLSRDAPGDPQLTSLDLTRAPSPNTER